MKTDLHPQYYPKTKVKCGCGNEFTVGSTKEKLDIEICYKCHPFFTGKENLIDTAGRIEKFKARRAKAAETKTKTKPKAIKKKTRVKKQELRSKS